MEETLDLLETATSDIQSWARPIITGLDQDPSIKQEVLRNPDLKAKIEIIISSAFHQNFEDSDFCEDGMYLSYLKQYPPKIGEAVITELKKRPDFYGYISRHISVFQI